jgi:mannose-6-phosphate isomerase-like protein (cupin superfamily)
MSSNTKPPVILSSILAGNKEKEEIILQLNIISSLLTSLLTTESMPSRYALIRTSGLASILKVLIYDHAENDADLNQIQLYSAYLLTGLSSENCATETANCDKSIMYALESALLHRITEIRMAGLLNPAQAEKSLMPNSGAEKAWRTDSKELPVLYNNKVERIQLDFEVSLLPFKTEILDPRIVKIPEGKSNEKHKHAHETIFVFMQGSGMVSIDEVNIEVSAGDIVFIPRWSIHQTCNTGQEQLSFLAVADFGFTGKAYMGNYVKTTRMRPEREFKR